MNACQQFSLPSNNQFCTAALGSIGDLLGCPTHADRRDRICPTQAEPGELLGMFTFEIRIDVRASSHEPRSDSDYFDAAVSQFGAQALRKSHGRELGTAVWKQMRNAYFSAYRSDVHDPRLGATLHIRQHSQGSVDMTPKVDLHGL